MSAKTVLTPILALAASLQLSYAKSNDSDVPETKVVEGEIEHDDYEIEIDDCCDHGQGKVKKDRYQDVEEQEHVIEEEVIPLGWWEHLKLPSIKSSR